MPCREKREPVCPQQPVLSLDLEHSLRERLEGRGLTSGNEFDPLVVHTLSYHSGTRRVSVELQDGSHFEYSLPVPVRPGVRRREEKSQSRGRTPRISRLMALAIHFEGLVSDGAVRNYRETEAGQVSRARLSQILQLTHLAPEIQEQLLWHCHGEQM
jgi:hypothetical protein